MIVFLDVAGERVEYADRHAAAKPEHLVGLGAVPADFDFAF